MHRLSCPALCLLLAAACQPHRAASGRSALAPSDSAGVSTPACTSAAGRRVHPVEMPFYATLAPADSADHTLPPPMRALVLGDVGKRLRARIAAEAGGTGELPLVDSLYGSTPFALQVHFTLYGDGAVGAFRFADGGQLTRPASPAQAAGDSLFARHAREAVEAGAAEGTTWAFSDRGRADSTRLVLAATPNRPRSEDSSTAAVPVFRITAEMEQPAVPRKSAPVRYPRNPEASLFKATIVMQFVVDETGRPVPSTIEPIRTPGDVPADLEPLYQEFVSAARYGIERSTYRPAEVGGCPVRQKVQQPFDFGRPR